ncbi:DNA-binding protein [Lichenihabitans sp. Uapishka_5]|uniref:DNA-binding protein n=1 Tax=Lichenihabitans sp. Uapishka_5 TaxID=3037302 RepID=UPI0029E8170B|nr:DNA-binding protein [Lichenihabitans sp. Uapishka_5]MDX7953399.1 DNA-binding protein [Lichenihabitans sp. Uapishka_5]
MSAATARSAFTIAEFGDRYRLGRTAIYEQIKTGNLVARKIGVKTLILAEDAERWASSLPRLGGSA